VTERGRATEFLDTEDLVALAEQLFGQPAPIRDLGLLGSAAGRPTTSAFREDAYPTVHDKAAALLHSLARNHPLVDGNERLAWLATATFLELNEESVLDAGQDIVVELVVAVARGELDVPEIADRLQTIAPPKGRARATTARPPRRA
jgi:death-on-curing protein